MNAIFLAQTDTTAGFLSLDSARLNLIKGRDPRQKILRAARDLRTLKTLARVPAAHKNLIRRSRKITFLFPNGEAVRIASGDHKSFFARQSWFYSTSANLSGREFDLNIAENLADTITRDSRGFFAAPASAIYKLSRAKIKKLR
ncbi:MAG: Sua5 YciO YrdC YwlC family protein [Helicobacteraceae bacterium]|jgi:tRNA A37 threonylcarbamoyladenosine synthetase subunit TsaC/SUA5/YrdC|nr:Sua5 YciO YrdC YwlC family protein [Helicobacteraceae bacterium]